MGQPRKSSKRVIALDSSDVETPLSPLKSTYGDGGKGSKASPSKKSTSSKAPKRTSPTKQKTKPVNLEDQGLRNSKDKPIYSFFNAVSSKHDSDGPKQPAVTQDQPELSTDDLELILNSSDEEATRSVTLAKGSSTVSALRKRRFQYSQDSTESSRSSATNAQKFLKTNRSERAPFIAVNNTDKRPWTEQFAPATVDELAVHKRKIADVRAWLQSALAGRRHKILVLKGPAGSAKTAAIRALAHEANLQVMEWRNPSGGELVSESDFSASTQFEDFIARTGRTNSLALSPSMSRQSDVAHKDNSSEANLHQQLILIEEFPNTYATSSPVLQAFRSTLLYYLASVPATKQSIIPVVLIISETLLSTNTAAVDSFTAHRLLGPDLLMHPYLNVIEFNPIAPTIMIKALDNAILEEARKSGRRRAPGPQILKYLAESGDIRSALSTLEFLCLRANGDELWSSKIGFGKTNKKIAESPLTEAEIEAIKTINNRESSLSIFHAVGRIVYNNRIDPSTESPPVQPPSWMPENFRNRLPEKSPDDLINQIGTDVATFIAALHENYVPSCSCSTADRTLETLDSCVSDLSDADLLSIDRFSSNSRSIAGASSDVFRQDEISFQLAVRGLLFRLPSPVHRSTIPQLRKGDAHRMFYPSSLKIWRKIEETESHLRVLTARAQSGILLSSASAVYGSGSGVDSWRGRNSTDSGQSTKRTDEEQIGSSPNPTVSREEMLLDRLPYLEQIMRNKYTGLKKPLDLERIATITHVGGFVADDDTAEDTVLDANQVENEAEHWSTDKADVDGTELKKPVAQILGRRARLETEGGGLSIPVEHSVEKLVLEDDDIVD